MTRTQLNKLSKEELVELAIKQNEQMDALKGYKSGLTRKMLETFNSKVLIDCYLKNQKTLKKNSNNNVIGHKSKGGKYIC